MRSKSRLHPGNAGLGLDHMSAGDKLALAMIPEIDIWRAANLMLKRYGTKALEESAARADELVAQDSPARARDTARSAALTTCNLIPQPDRSCRFSRRPTPPVAQVSFLITDFIRFTRHRPTGPSLPCAQNVIALIADARPVRTGLR